MRHIFVINTYGHFYAWSFRTTNLKLICSKGHDFIYFVSMTKVSIPQQILGNIRQIDNLDLLQSRWPFKGYLAARECLRFVVVWTVLSEASIIWNNDPYFKCALCGQQRDFLIPFDIMKIQMLFPLPTATCYQVLAIQKLISQWYMVSHLLLLSIFWCGWCLRYFRECLSLAHLMLQCSQCYDMVYFLS